MEGTGGKEGGQGGGKERKDGKEEERENVGRNLAAGLQDKTFKRSLR